MHIKTLFQNIIYGCCEKYVQFRKENRTNIKIQNSPLFRFSSWEKSQKMLWEPECCVAKKGKDICVLRASPLPPNPAPNTNLIWFGIPSWEQSLPNCVTLENHVIFPCLSFLTCKMELIKMSHWTGAKIQYEK